MKKLDYIQQKIIQPAKLNNKLAFWSFHNKKIVFTNGCFDLLHQGHITYLSRAADLGDVLIIGLNSDASVSRIKAKGRPVSNQESRALMLASMQFVSAVIIFDEDTPLELIKKIQPDVLVKGKDYKEEDVVGYDIVKKKGGEVVTIDLVEGFSTTALIERIKQAW